MWSRLYFVAQALAGGAWWVAVFLSPAVREATLGSLDPVIVAIFDIPLFVCASAVAALGSRVAAVIAAVWTFIVTGCLAVYATVTTEAGLGVLLMAGAAAGSAVGLCFVLLGRLPTEWIVSRGPFAFRPANARASSFAHVATTAFQILIFWGFFLGVVPLVLAFVEQRWGLSMPFPPIAGPTGFVVFLLASALGLWSAAAMSTRGAGTPLPAAMPNRLVIAGPYRFVRNPMAIAGFVQGVAVGLLLSSWLVVAYSIAGSLMWNYVIRPLEESDLEARFGDEYRRYRDTVRCWWPRLRALPAGQIGAMHDADDVKAPVVS
ncbi:methyltransferase family protein [Agromyces ramosus]|uniref:Protein-S-isoprenylcysteine O-methyltransferase Ste14 n=1 Tax=Agromyces ramosus TaxID=33879 RepID=A0ABU0RAS1_9MICO|nr:isoprenylcysteine carboxylmethyltransferase family protein [Agromyces ramosus]MDQ0894867.1 protein-S-isoprenylcysteine O-methyltransferase Ste14 [Agromyces ramosus]